MTTYPVAGPESDRSVFLKLFALFAGITIPVVMLIGLWLAISAQNARDDARQAVTTARKASSSPGTAMPAATSSARGAVASPSFAGVAPANADALAMAHAAFPATLPAAPTGAIANVRLDISHSTVSIAPGINYDAWTFGNTAPGPVIHVRVGQTVRVTLHYASPMPLSVDFHAAEVAPNVAFSDVLPG